MVMGSIREFNRAVPFVPYEIRMVDGERYTVPHPDFISISPRSTFVVIIDAKDRPLHLADKPCMIADTAEEKHLRSFQIAGR